MKAQTFLDAKTQHLVALGAAVAAKCQNCFAGLYGSAAQAGLSDNEIRAVVAIAEKVTEKSHGFMAEFVEKTTHGAIRHTSEGEAAAGCGCS
jgi:AhpD family alkylhydroperoxidase